MRYIIIFLLMFFLAFHSCEKIDYYFPKPECNSDWLTNAYYHTNVYNPPDVQNASDALSATIDGTSWKAAPYAYYYKGKIMIAGSNKDYQMQITFSENDPSDVTIGFTPYKYNGYILSLKEKNVTLNSFDRITKTVNLNFSFKFEIHSSSPVFDGFVTVENGKARGVKCSELFCRPVYTLASEDSDLYGDWQLVEITDCLKDSVYYPPCSTWTGLNFDTVNKSGTDYRDLPYNYDLNAYCRNDLWLSYKFLNDTTLITSTGGATQAGDAVYVMDYEYFFFTLMHSDTFTLKKNRNLLELKTRNNKSLRFHK